MYIQFLEVTNFRKLQSVRIDLANETTLFVGANNSGKTSAMAALRRFLLEPHLFAGNDFTLSKWPAINKLGVEWEKEGEISAGLTLKEWVPFFPALDVWITVAPEEIHHVSHLIPTLDWTSGDIGVRLQYEPKDLVELSKGYVRARKEASEAMKGAKDKNPDGVYTLELWPANLRDFIERRLSSKFTLRAYILDPAQRQEPTSEGVARPQLLTANSVSLEGDPFDGLLRIDEINAQRGFGDPTPVKDASEETFSRKHSEKRRLSEQLRDYYRRHIDPAESPDASDIDALEAICKAQAEFDKKLRGGFSPSLQEVEGMGYPGFSDPALVITTKIHPVDGLNHSSALQYEVICQKADAKEQTPRLPEHYNGLGYQNLISMIFRLMSFRDGWMQVGKARKKDLEEEEFSPPPLHLVLIEEPEAHLHVQVQQVFIRKAYEILRKHSDLGRSPHFTTQLIVSTHSSHIAHECEFSTLRYFRRRPAVEKGEVPTSTVINLTEVFGDHDDTKKFVVRYLQATHCDLFFADAAVLVEGPAERMLVPHFIRSRYPELHKAYITLLEIGGSHAHRLAPLINKLQLITLVVTDLDTCDPVASGKAARPQRGRSLATGNSTLKDWVPKKDLADELFDLPAADKELRTGTFFAVRAAYQKPLVVTFKEQSREALPYTFEDALVFQNLDTFIAATGTGLLAKFRAALDASATLDDLSKRLFDILRDKADKAGFALDLLMLDKFRDLKVPNYIHEGLQWLETQIKQKHADTLTAVAAVAVEASEPSGPEAPKGKTTPKSVSAKAKMK